MSEEVLLDTIIDEISMGPFGSDIKVDNFISDGIPVLNGSNLTKVKLVENSFNYISETKANSLGKANAKSGDIVVTHRGTLGQLSYIPAKSKYKRYVVSQSQFRVRFNKEINPIYIAYLFRTDYGQRKLLSFKNHVGVPALAQATTNFKQLKLYLHNYKDQNRIASVLSSLDDKIELNNHINAELEAMEKTFYDYWFVQFDFPDANGKPYKSSGGKMVYNEELKREIPEGWEVKSLCEIANITMGQSPSGESFNDNGEGIIFYQGSTDFGIRFPFIRQYTTQPTRFAKQGDILLSVRAPVGTFNIAATDCCIGRGLAAINSKNNSICFLYQIIRNLKQVFDRRNVDGTTFGSITKDDLFSLKVILPNKKILLSYEDIINPFWGKQNNIQKENQRLASLRDWLLPMLMNGQVGFNADYQEQALTVSVAAEANAEYKPSASKNDNYHKIQSVYAVLWANSLLGVKQGEMATAKDLYLVDRITGVNTGFTYAQHNWGSFDPAFKKTINNTQYFTKRNFSNSRAYYCDTADNGYLLAKIPENTKEIVKSSIEELHDKIFKNYSGKQKAEMKELYATVLKCIEDTQNTTLAVIRQAMEGWKTPKQNFPDKAAKFSAEQTKEVLDRIIKEGWDKNVIIK